MHWYFRSCDIFLKTTCHITHDYIEMSASCTVMQMKRTGMMLISHCVIHYVFSNIMTGAYKTPPYNGCVLLLAKCWTGNISRRIINIFAKVTDTKAITIEVTRLLCM